MENLTAMSRPTSNNAAECTRSKVCGAVELDRWLGLPANGQLLGCHVEIERGRLKRGDFDSSKLRRVSLFERPGPIALIRSN